MYLINEIFYSIQGEGARAGSANVFVRFSGCNMKCRFCDTDHICYRSMSAADIAVRVAMLMPRASVVLTGGEPCLQYDQELKDALLASGTEFIAMETNGSLKPKALAHYICCSPKVPECVLERSFPDGVDELKYVIGKDSGIPHPRTSTKHWFLSPEFRGGRPAPGALERCIQLVLANPHWRLSTQNHKYWRVK